MIGPSIPAKLTKAPQQNASKDDSESSDDDYGPALPPDLAPRPTEKRVLGPSFPTGPPEEDSDDDYGPTPMPEKHQQEEVNGVQEFLAQEERRRKAIEEDAKPKALQRQEWMLAPPVASKLLGSLDSSGKLKARQFQRNAEEKVTDQTLWTETPAERQQRLADEISGKRKRAEISAGSEVQVELNDDERRKRRRDDEIKQEVHKHNKKSRAESLLEIHSKTAGASTSKDSDEPKGPPAIWDRDRDMGLGGRLMGDAQRQNLIRDAKGLGSRFGHSKSGQYM